MIRLTILSILSQILLSASPDEWRGRVIYQLLTDRFAQTEFTTQPCANLSNYCGGTFQGIINNLSYIQGMGFDAIWMSPIPENYPEGYHGYWATNWYEINSNFGDSDDLIMLTSTLHENNMFAMLDVVANHVGPVGANFSQVVPFNQPMYYHTNCTFAPNNFCNITNQTNMTVNLQCFFCRLFDLPDLAQELPLTSSILLNWVSNVVSSYQFDGLRVDTVPYVPIWFWQLYNASAGVYMMGEVCTADVNFSALHQGTAMDGLLNYPMFYLIRNVFQSGYAMTNITQFYQNASQYVDQGLLGVFVDNHDQPRFLNGSSSIPMFQSALAFSLSVTGIPIVYYGDEQEFSGGNDPNNREVLWTSMYSSAPTYQFLAKIIAFRQQTQYWTLPQVELLSDANVYVFSRGSYLFLFTNTNVTQVRSLNVSSLNYSNQEVLCNLFMETDCVTVSNGSLGIVMNGMAKFYSPVVTSTF